MTADYGFLRDSVSDSVVPFLVVYILPLRLYFATVVDVKGPSAPIAKRLSQLIKEIGLTH